MESPSRQRLEFARDFDGKIYLTSAIEKGEGLSLNALCLSAENGKLLWNTPIFAVDSRPRMHRKNSQASPTPIVDGQQVYVHFGHMGTAASVSMARSPGK